MAELNLFFPQWQGAGTPHYLYDGALALQKAFGLKGFQEIAVSLNEDLKEEELVLGLSPITQQLEKALDIIQRQNPATIFTVGGGCDTEIPAVAYLNKRYGVKLSVLWFDAHGDLNTPASSTSKLFHGMPLRSLLGDCPAAIGKLLVSQLVPWQITMLGVRELDAPEAFYMEEQDIAVLSVAQLSRGIEYNWMSSLEENIYIHVDVDVLDPVDFPNVMCPASQGISKETLYTTLDRLQKCKRIVGMSLLEYGADDGTVPEIMGKIIKMGESI